MSERIILDYKDWIKRLIPSRTHKTRYFDEEFLQRFPGSTETKLSLCTTVTFFYTTLLLSDWLLLAAHLMAAGQPTLLLMHYQPSILYGYVIHITRRARCNAYLKESIFHHTLALLASAIDRSRCIKDIGYLSPIWL